MDINIIKHYYDCFERELIKKLYKLFYLLTFNKFELVRKVPKLTPEEYAKRQFDDLVLCLGEVHGLEYGIVKRVLFNLSTELSNESFSPGFIKNSRVEYFLKVRKEHEKLVGSTDLKKHYNYLLKNGEELVKSRMK